MKSALDYEIETVSVQLLKYEQEVINCCKEIAYLYLQQTFALDRYNHYRSIGNPVKTLYWDELSDYIEDLIIAKKEQRDSASKNEFEYRNKKIDLLQKSIDELLEPFRKLRERQDKYAKNTNA